MYSGEGKPILNVGNIIPHAEVTGWTDIEDGKKPLGKACIVLSDGGNNVTSSFMLHHALSITIDFTPPKLFWAGVFLKPWEHN